MQLHAVRRDDWSFLTTMKYAALAVLLFVCWVPAFPVRAQTNADFSCQIVDGLQRPVPGVAVELYRIQKQAGGQEEKIRLAVAYSVVDGTAHATYDQSSFPTNDSFYVTLTKSNYAGYTAGPQSDYVLRRVFHAEDVARIAKMPGADQKKDLQELLAGEMDSPVGLSELVFVKESKLRLSLRFFLNDPLIGAQAGGLLAFIGQPDDYGVIVQNAPSPNGDPVVNRWAYNIAAALLEPSGERQWSFLERCAANDYNDRWVDLAAIRTLKLIASPRSVKALETVRRQNPYRAGQIDAALAYINSKPPPLADADLIAAGNKVADALDLGLSMGNEKPRYNDERDMALIDCNFLSNGTQSLVYTATFQKTANDWKLRGVRQTRQTTLPRGPESHKPEASK